jgi:hypothetical protein
LVALKKIIMHNEKDGVGAPPSASSDAGLSDNPSVPDHSPPRNQAAKASLTSKHPEIGRHGGRISGEEQQVHLFF